MTRFQPGTKSLEALDLSIRATLATRGLWGIEQMTVSIQTTEIYGTMFVHTCFAASLA
jgi:hypothetical protein